MAGNKLTVPRNGGRDKSDSAFKKNEILVYLKQGLSYRKSCKQAEVPINTVRSWRERDVIFDDAIKGVLADKGVSRPAPTTPESCLRNDSMIKNEEREAIIDEVCKGLAFGLEIDFSCMLASVEKRTLRGWMQEDTSIMLRINKARAKNMAWWIEKIRKGAETDWRAAVCYLERMFPHLWAEVKQVEITARNQYEDPMALKTIDIERAAIQNVKHMSNDELVKLAEKHVGEI